MIKLPGTRWPIVNTSPNCTNSLGSRRLIMFGQLFIAALSPNFWWGDLFSSNNCESVFFHFVSASSGMIILFASRQKTPIISLWKHWIHPLTLDLMNVYTVNADENKDLFCVSVSLFKGGGGVRAFLYVWMGVRERCRVCCVCTCVSACRCYW